MVVEAIRDLMARAERGREILATSPVQGDPSFAGLRSDEFDEFTVRAVTDRVNYTIQGHCGNQMPPKRVEGILRSMGFKPTKAWEGYRFLPDPKRIEELIEKDVPDRNM